MKVVLLVCFLAIGVIECEVDDGKLTVCSQSGCILGTVLPGHRKQYEAFLGVPYAKPPIGELRFRNPQQIDPWGKAVWNGTYSRNTCIQKIFVTNAHASVGEEDCLYMNIYRPIRKSKRKLLPVIVLITGGGFSIGTANNVDFSPDYLMNRIDFIFIALQHRLGAFGYLCSGDSACPGNFGLKDQQMALEWIRDNIEAFGGNSLSVTLLGQGSGSAAVQMHMMNPKSSILFQRVILQSGSLAYWALLKDPQSQFKRQAKYVGIKGYNNLTSSEIVAKLRKVDAGVITESSNKMKFWHNDHVVNYRPCIEEAEWENAFLTKNPFNAWANGSYTPKPILITFTPNDGTYRAPILTNETLLGELNEKMDKILPKLLEFPSKYVDDVLNFYFGNQNRHIDQTNDYIFTNMISDRYFHQSLYNNVKQFRKTFTSKKTPIYLYKFNFDSEYRYTKRTTRTDRNFGTGYRDDLLFMMSIPSVFPAIPFNSVEEQMSDLYVGALAYFANFGKKKTWYSHEKCTEDTKGFCEYQEFQRYTFYNKSDVIVRASNRFRIT